MATGPKPRNPLVVSVDGRRVWQATREFYPTAAEDVAVGSNPIRGTSCGAVFSGEVLSVERATRE